MNTHFSLMFFTVQLVRNVLITTAGIRILFSSFEKISAEFSGRNPPCRIVKPININENKTAIWKITDEKISTNSSPFKAKTPPVRGAEGVSFKSNYLQLHFASKLWQSVHWQTVGFASWVPTLIASSEQ